VMHMVHADVGREPAQDSRQVIMRHSEHLTAARPHSVIPFCHASEKDKRVAPPQPRCETLLT
jgi:hypothetical protein